MDAGKDGEFGFNSDIYSDHKLCLRRKRKRDDEGDHPQQIGVVKVILARASAYFKAIFESPMQDGDSAQGVTYICLDEEDSAVDPKELHAAYLSLLRAAHTGCLHGVPAASLPLVLHLADKYLFTQVTALCVSALEGEVNQDRDLALKALATGHCPAPLAGKCVDALAAGLQLGEVYALLELAAEGDPLAQKVRGVCSQWLVQEYGQDWPEHTPEPVLALEFAALELLLQSDDLVVRSENVVFMAIVDWIRFKPGRKQYFEPLWRHVRKYYLSTGFLLEVVTASLLVSDRELLSVIKKRLGSLYRYEWGKPRAYRNPPMPVEFPALATMGPDSRWQAKVLCNAVEVTVTYEARAVDRTYEVTLSVGGYAPVLQRELQAAVVLKNGTMVPCERWIAGSSRLVIPEYEQCHGVMLLVADIELPDRAGKLEGPLPAP